MKKLMSKKGFTLVELIIVIVVIAILAGLAAPKFMGVVRDAEHAAFVNDLAVLTTVATLVETTRGKNEAPYGTLDEDLPSDNENLNAALDEFIAAEGLTGKTIEDLGIKKINPAVYNKNLGKKVKTGSIDNYYVITETSAAGTIVFYADNGIVDKNGAEYFGLEIKK